MEDGFYRVDGDGNFQYAPNFVYAPTYTLMRADQLTYTYPTEGGWRWFNTDADARAFFGVPPAEV